MLPTTLYQTQTRNTYPNDIDFSMKGNSNLSRSFSASEHLSRDILDPNDLELGIALKRGVLFSSCKGSVGRRFLVLHWQVNWLMGPGVWQPVPSDDFLNNSLSKAFWKQMATYVMPFLRRCDLCERPVWGLSECVSKKKRPPKSSDFLLRWVISRVFVVFLVDLSSLRCVHDLRWTMIHAGVV